MTYEERLNLIGTLLRETILPRYKRPEHLDDNTARAELRDLVTDLNSVWPLMSAERFDMVGQAMGRALRLSYTGTAWPKAAHLAKALKQAQEAPPSSEDTRPASTSGEDREDWKRAQVRLWLSGEKPVAPHLVTRERLAAVGCPNVERAYQFAHDPWNEGICDELTDKDRARNAGVTA